MEPFQILEQSEESEMTEANYIEAPPTKELLPKV